MPQGIYNRTEEQKRKLRLLRIGKSAWNKGLHIKGHPWGKKAKKEQSKRMMGNINGKGNKGRKLSDKQIEILRKSHLGKLSPLKGRERLDIQGNKNPAWKGGIRSKNYIERRKFQQTIQKLVFERDNYTCQLCSQKGGKLQVDHIQPWAEYIELRFNMDNCRTLCMECHYQITFGKPMSKNIKGWGHNFMKGGKLK